MCCVHPHSLCAGEAFQEISDVDNDAREGIVLCSVSCFRFSKIEAVTSEVVKTQRAELLKKNKEQLKKEVRELNVKVNCRVNGASRDASKEVIVARVLEKKSYSFIHHGLLKFLKLMTMLQISFC
jgi:S-methylmethionine-dependent homocysteine/selenocysteine methylase